MQEEGVVITEDGLIGHTDLLFRVAFTLTKGNSALAEALAKQALTEAWQKRDECHGRIKPWLLTLLRQKFVSWLQTSAAAGQAACN
ncbi:MAG: hypothetical protein WCW26_02805 [Candidatus Buchananbacteria bacterium]